MITSNWNSRTTRGLFILVCGLVLLAAPFIGISGLEVDTFILWQIRIPRVLMGFLAGAILGLSGAVYQTVLHNPLATPSTIGTTAGAALGALVAVVFLPDQTTFIPVVVLAAFAGALIVTLMITAIAANGRASMHDVLLAGIAISLASGAIAAGVRFQADMAATFQAVRWSLGYLGQVGYGRVWILLPFALLVVVGLLAHRRALQTMIGGEDRARTVGVNVRRVRTQCLALGSLGVAACVALVGPIAFIGLIVPHLVRLGLRHSRRGLYLGSAVFGGVFLVACDSIARIVLPQQELPVGVITAAVGAPMMVWLITHRIREKAH